MVLKYDKYIWTTLYKALAREYSLVCKWDIDQVVLDIPYLHHDHDSYDMGQLQRL